MIPPPEFYFGPRPRPTPLGTASSRDPWATIGLTPLHSASLHSLPLTMCKEILLLAIPFIGFEAFSFLTHGLRYQLLVVPLPVVFYGHLTGIEATPVVLI
jgi:hypothetical protein